MEDIVLIVSILALLGLGFIPVFFLGRFLNRIRKPVIDRSKGGPDMAKRRNAAENDPVTEFNSTGEVFFGRNDGTRDPNMVQ